MQSSTLPDPADAERIKPDRVQTQGGEAPDADKAADALPASGTKADKADREDELLDEGLEETFPASDSVSAKHIT